MPNDFGPNPYAGGDPNDALRNTAMANWLRDQQQQRQKMPNLLATPPQGGMNTPPSQPAGGPMGGATSQSPGMTTGMGMAPQSVPMQSGPGAIPSQNFPAIPGAWNPNSEDPLYRGLTKDQFVDYSNRAHQAMDAYGNMAEYNRIMGDALKAANDNLATLGLQNRQTDIQQQQISAQRDERAKVLSELQAKIPGLADQMSKQLADQTQYAYGKIDPMIQQRLNSLGLLQSGALPEAQARAFKDLQMKAQGRVQDFENQANNQLQLQVPLMNTESDIGSQQQALQNLLGLQSAGMTRQFSNEDASAAYGQAMSQQQQALALARQQANQSGTNSWIDRGASLMSQVLPMLIKMMAAPATGGASMALPSPSMGPSGAGGGNAVYDSGLWGGS